MRHPWLSLWSALLNVNFGLSAMRHRIRRRERLWELALIGAAITVGGALGLFIVWQVVGAFFGAAAELGQPEFILTLVHLAASAVVFVFGIPFVMGAFYFSNDAQLLITWPLRPRAILAAKFATVLLNEYITTAFLLVPAYVLYARYVSVGAWYFPAALAAFLLTPVVPLALAAMVVVVLMRLVSGSNRKEYFAVLGVVLAAVAALSLQYFLESTPESPEEFLPVVLGRAHGLSEYVSAGYPLAFWAMLSTAEAGSPRGFAALAGLAAASLAATGLLLGTGERLFLRAAQTSGVSRSGRSGLAGLGKASAAPWSIARVERKLLLRTPMHVLNCLSTLIILPLLALLPVVDQEDTFERVLEAGRAHPLVGFAILWGWLALAMGMSVIPATAVSREGARLWILKSLPLSGKEYFLGKLLGAGSLVLPTALPGALLFGYIMQVRPIILLLGIVAGVVSSLLVAMLCLWLDMARPWLTWTDPTRAVKSNVNGILGMLISALLVVASALGGYLFVSRGLSAGAAAGLVFLAHLGAAAGLWLWVSPRLDRLHQRLGE